ncbi:DUF3616 domain-containing protein [Caballeronia sp. DA-9]|uniref:DUF3616 domain-containing protein n=1 Tax=Caballeronia sp. DA-9 TaxID=3436237 RepID=UPI003F6646A0
MTIRNHPRRIDTNTRFNMPGEAITARPTGQLRLYFEGGDANTTPASLSAVEQIDNALWVAGDESTTIERLTSNDYANYKDHVSLDLTRSFDLPGKEQEEIDLEGIAWDKENERLWLVGSHSLRRKKPRPDDSDADAFKALSKISRQDNRYLLGYLDFTRSDRRGDARALAAHPPSGHALPFDKGDNALIKTLRTSKTYAPFLDLPSKDNGLDIEGMAVANDRVFLGLRGPVLRGWATILQITLDLRTNGELELRPTDRKDRDYVRHVLDLDGLGIRDLCAYGNDLLILAGPTMVLDGPMRVFRWRDALGHEQGNCVDGRQLEMLLDLPYGDRVDHPEGITLFEQNGAAPLLLVVYDSASGGQMREGEYFKADLFAYPQ